MRQLAHLLQLAGRPVRGPSPSFEKPHLVLALIVIGESRIIGRQSLAVRSGLKEGPVRTVLRRFREDGYAETNASGCYLTEKGRSAYGAVRARISPFVSLEGSKLTIGARQVAVAVRRGGRAVGTGLEQRDAAVRLDASGATTFVIAGGKFTIPGGSPDSEADFPSRSWSALGKTLGPRNGDAVVVCGAKDEITAKLGALSAALTLI